jgi:hypothetical protein
MGLNALKRNMSKMSVDIVKCGEASWRESLVETIQTIDVRPLEGFMVLRDELMTSHIHRIYLHPRRLSVKSMVILENSTII